MLRAGDDHIDAPASALGAYQPRMPIRDGHLGAVALGHFGGVGLDLMPAIETPDDQTHARCRGIAERHRWTVVGIHRRRLLQNTDALLNCTARPL
jgi:hypothetical protein